MTCKPGHYCLWRSFGHSGPCPTCDSRRVIPPAMTLTAAAILANIHAVQTACPVRGDDSAADSGPVEPLMTDSDGDWLCCREQNIGRGRCA